MDDIDIPRVGWLWDSKAAQTREKLAAIKAKPKKALGQNFVTDDAILARIVRGSGVEKGDLVIEIGPGTGNLTKHILEAGATVLAVEKDYALAEELEGVFREWRTFRVTQGDAVRRNLPKLVEQLREFHNETVAAGNDVAPATPVTRVKVVANLPYNITTDILKILLPMGDAVSHIAFMLQDEVAQRLVSTKPEGSQYRAMTVIAHHYSRPSYEFKIDRQCYFPVPQVHGALAVFALKTAAQRSPVPNEREFMSFIRQSFNSKRKMLANALQPLWQREEVAEALGDLGLNPQARAQDLAVHEYVDLYVQVTALKAARVASAEEAS